MRINRFPDSTLQSKVMLHAVHLVDLLGKLKSAVRKDKSLGQDFYELLLHAIWKDGEEGNHEEIARTMLEMIEPERLGGIKSFETMFSESAFQLCWCCGAEIHPENTAKVARRTCCVKCVESHGLRRDGA